MWRIFVLTLTYSCDLWVVSERRRLWIQATKMSFLFRVAGPSLCEFPVVINAVSIYHESPTGCGTALKRRCHVSRCQPQPVLVKESGCTRGALQQSPSCPKATVCSAALKLGVTSILALDRVNVHTAHWAGRKSDIRLAQRIWWIHFLEEIWATYVVTFLNFDTTLPFYTCSSWTNKTARYVIKQADYRAILTWPQIHIIYDKSHLTFKN